MSLKTLRIHGRFGSFVHSCSPLASSRPEGGQMRAAAARDCLTVCTGPVCGKRSLTIGQANASYENLGTGKETWQF